MQRPTDFAIIPDQNSISQIEREIRFFDANCENPKALSENQIETWNRDGYLGPIEVCSPTEIVEVRQYFDRLLEQTFAAGQDSYSISSAHLKHRRVLELLKNPKLVDYVSDLLGENVVGWGAHFFCKMPGDGKQVDWHQDCSYWPLTPTKAITIWLAIDDADQENGCMEVYRGSHRFGLVDFETSEHSDGNVLDQSIKNPEQYGQHQLTPLLAGQASIHSDLLIHGSAPNLSNRRRCGLTLRYSPADVTAYLGWNQKGVVVRGAADPKIWPGASLPQVD